MYLFVGDTLHTLDLVLLLSVWLRQDFTSVLLLKCEDLQNQ